jgi:hypothetical protein
MSRFVVSSVTGHTINPASTNATGGRQPLGPPTSYFIHDRAFNYRVVASYVPQYGRTRLYCKEHAERCCDRLNAWAADQ